VEEEVLQILKIRSGDEGVELDEEAFELLSKMASNTSLRYTMQLISLSSILRQRRKGDKVNKEDIGKCYRLFTDVKRCVKKLEQNQGTFLE